MVRDIPKFNSRSFHSGRKWPWRNRGTARCYTLRVRGMNAADGKEQEAETRRNLTETEFAQLPGSHAHYFAIITLDRTFLCRLSATMSASEN